MNLIIFYIAVAFCACVLGSPLKESEDVAENSGNNIPDGYGGMKYVDDNAEQEMMPFFNAANDVRFLVFTRLNPTIGQVLRFRDLESLSLTNFDVSRPTRVLIHGFQSDATADVNVLLTAAYLRNYDVNIIVVDWSVGASTINYISARNRVFEVGPLVAQLLDFLQENISFDYSRLTIVGHSLGAHIAGITGKNVRRGRIDTIIGLDPAGPLFDANNPRSRLDFTDAIYVEVIHSDTRNFGIGAVIGHADFFPNNGSNQPGCLTTICDHGRAVLFFIESINSIRLRSNRCSGVAEINNNQICTGETALLGGEPSNAQRNIRGIFQLFTNNQSPFGRG